MNRRADPWVFGFFLVCLVAFACLILFGSCAATPAAGFRRIADHMLTSCRANNVSPDARHQCTLEVRAFCTSRGLEKTCGEGI